MEGRGSLSHLIKEDILSRVIDKTGRQYGRLTVLNRAESKHGRVYWLCRCVCGELSLVRSESLQDGGTQSCGCLQKERARETRPVVDETGNRHGKLTVLGRAGLTRNRQILWRCLCDCGNESVVTGGSLRSGNTQSCGCLRKERLRLPTGVASFNALIDSIKRSARQRGYAWQLTNNQVKILTSQSCYYCGAEPSPSQGGKSFIRYNGVYLRNGLDRVDNERGYEIGNVVASCKRCNRAKDTMEQDEFLAWISQVYEHSINKREG